MTGALVGPLPAIRFHDGTRQAYDVPRDTLDIRWAACTDHHPACDCREAELAEHIGEYHAEYKAITSAILAATEGHQAWAWTTVGEMGEYVEDEFAQCKCQLCAIRRACHIGRSDCMRAEREARQRLNDAARERQAARYAQMFPDMDEVPF